MFPDCLYSYIAPSVLSSSVFAATTMLIKLFTHTIIERAFIKEEYFTISLLDGTTVFKKIRKEY